MKRFGKINVGMKNVSERSDTGGIPISKMIQNKISIVNNTEFKCKTTMYQAQLVLIECKTKESHGNLVAETPPAEKKD